MKHVASQQWWFVTGAAHVDHHMVTCKSWVKQSVLYWQNDKQTCDLLLSLWEHILDILLTLLGHFIYASICLNLTSLKSAKYQEQFQLTQWNSYSISHQHGTKTTQWLDSDGVVTVVNCWQHGDYTVDQLCSHSAASSCLNCDYIPHCPVTVQSL